MQVPYHLAAACCKVFELLLQTTPSSTTPRSSTAGGGSSSSSSSRGHDSRDAFEHSSPAVPAQAERAVRVDVPVQALCVLLGSVVIAQASQQCPVPVAACVQQLQRSGLLELLPKLLVCSAEKLRTAHSSTSGNRRSDSLSSSEGSSNSGRGSGSSCGRGSGTAGSTSAPDSTAEGQQLGLLGNLRTCNDCLRLYSILAQCWPHGVLPRDLLPQHAEPVLQAVFAACQGVIHLLGQPELQHAAPLLSKLLSVWDRAAEVFTVLCRAFQLNTSGAIQPGPNQPPPQQYADALLQSPSLLPCVALDMATSIHALLLLQQQDSGLVAAAWPLDWQTSQRNITTFSGCNFGNSSTAAAAGSSSSRQGAGSSSSRQGAGSSGGGPRGSSSGTVGGSRTSNISSTGTTGSNAHTTQSSSSSSANMALELWASQGSDGSDILHCASQMLADLPASHSKLFSLLGCDSMSVLVTAAAQAERLREGGASMLRTYLGSLLAAGSVYGCLALHPAGQRQASTQMQQHVRAVHYMMPALLLHFAAEQTVRPACEQIFAWERFIEPSYRAIAAATVAWHEDLAAGMYLSSPADLQQVLLHDLLPMVVQISSAVLGLPGPAAYRTYGSASRGSMQSSTAATVNVHFPDPVQFELAVCLVRCVSGAAHTSQGRCGSPLTVPASALGSHVMTTSTQTF